MENRERMEGGINQLPRTRTSSVPGRPISMTVRIMKGLHTISSFVEAMFGVAVAGENNDLVATVLQPHRSINDQSLGASDS